MSAAPMPTLRTERLVLRPFRLDDAAAVERLAGAREVADTTLTIPHPYPAGAAASWIATHAASWARDERLSMAIAMLESPADPVGAMGLAISRAHERAELGYWIGVDWWGRGFATEAARAIVAFAFEGLALHRVQAQCFTRNPASARVLEKLGMQAEGVHRAAYKRFGKFEDVAMYAILASEWPIE